MPMIFSFFYYALGTALNRQDINQIAHDFAHQVLSDFYDEHRRNRYDPSMLQSHQTGCIRE